MDKLTFSVGQNIIYNGYEHEIIKHIDLKNIMIQNLSTKEKQIIAINDIENDKDTSNSTKDDIYDIPEKYWNEAKRRLEIIKPLLHKNKTKADVEKIAIQYNLHTSTIYRWLDSYSKTELLTSLVPKNSLKGAKGSIRISEETDLIIKKTIDDMYLSKQKYSIRKTYFAIVRKCKNAKIPVPSENTVRKRIKDISNKEILRRRESPRLADRKYRNTDGMFPAGKYPLDFIQIDHTPMDIIVVDEIYGQPIGRPYLTIAMDIYSRMVTGFYISLDDPSYFSVAQCLTQSILPKEKYLRNLDIEGEWNVWGLPKTIGLDNASEFRGKDLQRVCEQYGIEINWRPVARPQFGGHIERLIGTAMREIHTLPGTTFSNINQRGEYKPDKEAHITLSSLEKWFAEYIVNIYHKQIHSGINSTPEKRYEIGILGDELTPGRGLPERIIDEDRFKISLLPTIERTIQQFGVKIDNIQYYADSLRRWIKAKDDKGNARKFIFKRDLRDISTIWFHDPDIKEYFPIPYRNISYPPISIWDLRAIKKYLDDKKITGYDEITIFTTYEKLKKIEEASAKKVKSIRRKQTARKSREKKKKFDNIKKTNPTIETNEESIDSISNLYQDIEPFDEIEIL